MAPETRSTASKRNHFSVVEELGRYEGLNKRQRRLQSLEEPCFPSIACLGRHHSKYISAEVLPGYFLDLDFFNEEGFQFVKWFKDVNWVSIVGMKQRFYPELVKQFYANLSYNADKTHICSYVKGQEIRLNQNLLEEILGIPNLGTEIYDISNWVDEDAGVSRIEALRVILDKPDLVEQSKVYSCNLKLDMRLFHQMVVHIILPRKRSFNRVCDLDLLVMWHIVKEKPINLPFVLLSHMIACSGKKNSYLPYGMILTSIFKHYKVSLEEVEGKELESCNIYSEVTLHKLGYVRGEKEWFLKKDKAKLQSAEKLNVSKTRDAPSSLQTTSDGNTLMFVSTSKQTSVTEGIYILVKGIREVMSTMSMESKLDDLQLKIGHLRNLLDQLRTSRKERTVGDIFLLLEVIMGDMRGLRCEMDTVGSKIDYLESQLIEFLSQSQDDKVSIEWMIGETVNLKRQNKSFIYRFEAFRSEIQDFWDCLSAKI